MVYQSGTSRWFSVQH